MIRENLDALRAAIRAVCQKTGRDPDSVTLVGVTKFAEVDDIKIALDGGLRDIAENKVQSAQKKFAALPSRGGGVRRHMIGHLQTNKVKDALEIFDVIQSVDSLKLAKVINDQAQKKGRPVEILIQVNTSGEQQKFGITPQETIPLFKDIEPLTHLYVTGLMTIGPMTDEESSIRKSFRDLREIFEKLSAVYPRHPRIVMKHLSMGMSQDFVIALQEG